MSLDVTLLVLRVAIALALYAFLAVLLVILWRDVSLAARQRGDRQISSAALMVLECEDGSLEVGQRYPLSLVTTLGRAPTSAIVIPDTFASTDHAHITQRAGQWWLEDQRSRNGTLLNDLPVTDPVVLASGDVIGIGHVRLRVELN